MGSDAQAEFVINACLALDDDAAVKVITDTLTLRPEVAPVVVNQTCPKLTYAPASSMTSRRSAGIVKTTPGANGFGLLACPEIKLIFGQDVYVHQDQLGDLTPGTEVNFAVLLSKDMKPQAFDIQRGHEGASLPTSVNASHMAAAKLLAPKGPGGGNPGPPGMTGPPPALMPPMAPPPMMPPPPMGDMGGKGGGWLGPAFSDKGDGKGNGKDFGGGQDFGKGYGKDFGKY
jgi:hypothetical protein